MIKARPLPKAKKSSKVDHKFPGHIIMLREIYDCPRGILSKDLAIRLGIPYGQNFNKRAAKYCRRVNRNGEVVRRELDGRQHRWFPVLKDFQIARRIAIGETS
jgi:hypothetical protein